MNRIRAGNYGGVISFLCYVAAVVFFAVLTFGGSLGTVPLQPAGLLCLALGFVFARVGL